jgi:hypothetical protein
VLAGMESFIRQCRDDVEILIELSLEWWPDQTRRPIDVLEPFFRAGFHAYEVDNNYWPWRYLWAWSTRPPRRCRRDLTERSARIDLVLSRRDVEKRSRRWVFVGGLCIGLSIVVKIIGLYLAGGIAVFLVYNSAFDDEEPEPRLHPQRLATGSYR